MRISDWSSDVCSSDLNYWGDWLDRLQRLYSRSTQPMRIRNVHGCSHCKNPRVPGLGGYGGRIVASECLEPERTPGFLEGIRSRASGTGSSMVHASAEDPNNLAMRDAVFKAYQGRIDPRDIEPRFGLFEIHERGPGINLAGLRAIA